ncbi:MAG: argininosuccinate lyase, partial [Deltaproteobacteria bacterium]|nr:argininosuccinate lyase [Deltaproteobacteria bacterium]
MVLAKTDAAGERGLMPEVLEFSSSLALDKRLLREDLVGSIAHLTMLSRTGIIPKDAAAKLKQGLKDIWAAQAAGTLELPNEEDVHMAVEATLAKNVGEVSGLLHSARSRNDQVALDLRLHVREMCVRALNKLADLVDGLSKRAAAETDTLLPSYTHRQRAQPISLAYLLCGWGAMFARDAEAILFVLEQVDALPLGVGAIAGTSLPIDREITRKLLQFSKLTLNGLDTVGDRDFALDYTYAAARSLLHVSRISTDLIDFSTGEFGFVKLDGAIACGSSMMPQKKNPDVFELLRGKSGRGVGNLVSLLMTLKGLPSGYNRDQQEDRLPLLETAPLLIGALEMLELALGRVRFDPERTFAALANDYTQATDVAEALVLEGVPFRVAYGLVGKLVRACQDMKLPLSRATIELAQAIDPRLNANVLKACDPRASVERKRNAGGTGPASVRAQIDALG